MKNNLPWNKNFIYYLPLKSVLFLWMIQIDSHIIILFTKELGNLH